MCPPWLGCCVRLAGLVSQFVSHLALSFTLAGVLRPPRWACLPICLPICLPSGFVFHLGWGAVSASPGFPPNQFTVGVLNAVLSVSALAGVPCPPRWACLPSCLPICLPSGFVFHLGWGAASASLGLSPNLSPNLSPIWLCLSPWLGCCLAGLVSQFISHLALSFTWGCCVRIAGLVSQFVSHLALSFSLAAVLCPPRWACLRPNLSPTWLCLSRWLGCCVRLAGLGLVSQFVSQYSLPICFPSGFVFHLGWGAASASLGLSPNLSPNLSPTWLCLLRWLGCCVRLAGLVSHLALSFTLAGVLCPPRGACLLIPQTVYGWGSQCFLSVSALTGMLCPPRWAPTLSPIWSGMLCPPRWSFCLSLVCGLVSGLVCHLGWDAVSASLGCLRSCLPACLPSGLGCSVRLPGLVFLLSLVLSPSFCLCFVS